MKHTTSTGLENLCRTPLSLPKDCRIGLLANPASVDGKFRHASRLINDLYPDRLKALFSPQHGFFAEKQDNMIESGHTMDPELGIPVFSLYSNTRKPTKEMMDAIDLLMIDIQDVGTRVYTFIYTISYCLEAAARYGKSVVILDRPNPVGGVRVEGNILEENCASFVGRYPIPMRHGLTVGEIALLFNKRHGINADLKVVPMENWARDMFFEDTGLPWIAPSPNLPTPASAMVYPGQVIFEGTNLSEGRGTTQPFELFGAPFVDTDAILANLEGRISGAVLRPVCFQPCSGKWQNHVCQGFQIHVTSPATYRSYGTSMMLLQQIMQLHPDGFQWKEPPYEYEYQRRPMDLILGNERLADQLLEMDGIDALEDSWKGPANEFKEMSREFQLYG
ncbi:MAG: DUF1343 domain-containing protein [Desulfobacteraceae bacterium]|nr:DUF1343 domain-containing protein [Desulfobacteraceae bacterium]